MLAVIADPRLQRQGLRNRRCHSNERRGTTVSEIRAETNLIGETKTAPWICQTEESPGAVADTQRKMWPSLHAVHSQYHSHVIFNYRPQSRDRGRLKFRTRRPVQPPFAIQTTTHTLPAINEQAVNAASLSVKCTFNMISLILKDKC